MSSPSIPFISATVTHHLQNNNRQFEGTLGGGGGGRVDRVSKGSWKRKIPNSIKEIPQTPENFGRKHTRGLTTMERKKNTNSQRKPTANSTKISDPSAYFTAQLSPKPDHRTDKLYLPESHSIQTKKSDKR